jgi:hypothetical protein
MAAIAEFNERREDMKARARNHRQEYDERFE